MVEWNGVFLPNGTPPNIVQVRGKAVQAAGNDPNVNEKLLRLELMPAGSSPESFSRFVQGESARVNALIERRATSRWLENLWTGATVSVEQGMVELA